MIGSLYKKRTYLVFSAGVSHNIPLLRDIMTEKKFDSGDISTKYLNDVYPEGFSGEHLKFLMSLQKVSITPQTRQSNLYLWLFIIFFCDNLTKIFKFCQTKFCILWKGFSIGLIKWSWVYLV